MLQQRQPERQQAADSRHCELENATNIAGREGERVEEGGVKGRKYGPERQAGSWQQKLKFGHK